MATVQLFLRLNYNSTNESNKNIEDVLKSMTSIEQVMQVRADHASEAKLELTFDPEQVSLSEIETMIQKNGASVTSVFVHFPGMITGMNDPYSASAKSFSIEEHIGCIEGIYSVSTSPGGEVKIEISPGHTNKDNIIKSTFEILMLGKNEKL